MALQDFALKIVAHATRSMSTGQQQRIERRRIDGVPALWRKVVRIGDHPGIGHPRIAIGPQKQPYQRELSQQRNRAPGIETLPCQHHIVSNGRPSVRRGKSDSVSGAAKHPPAHGSFAGIEIPRRQQKKDARHDPCLRPAEPSIPWSCAPRDRRGHGRRP